MQNDNAKFKIELKKRLYAFTLKLIGFIEALPNDNVSRRLSDQLLRSGTSVIANFVEGQSASSKKDFINFLTISLKSANETKLWLALLRDTKKAAKKDADWFLSEITEIANILASCILTLKGKR
ncbi:MAG: four helix bundle protein [Sedimentisphaerales bacterium]|nr:four helix bundle protein [Sedimentisphaerales bacterium]